MCLLEGGRRALREIIDYSKNFLSGETIERKRNKDDLNYRGIATVQLFDEKGNMVQEVKSENCINKRWLSYLYRSFFSTNLIFNTKTKFANYTPAYNMVLTNNTGEEDDNDLMIKGDLIGHADGWSAYSGEDKLKGTVNIAESINTQFKKHFVIDFPTHAANGTFQSIYWIIGASGESPAFSQFKEETVILELENNYIFAVRNKKLYGYNKDTKKEICTYDITTGKKLNSFEYTDTNNVISLGIHNDKLYVFTNSYANIYDFNWNFIEKKNLTRLPNTSTASIMAFRDYEYGFLAIDGNYYSHLFDSDLNEIRQCNIADDKKFQPSYTMYVGNNIFVGTAYYKDSTLNGQKYYDVNKDNITNWSINGYYQFMYSLDEGRKYYSSNFIYPYFDYNTNSLYYIGESDKKKPYYQATRIPWFAHTLLPAPVTKTATNTMKIQYDFIVEERGYFD